MSQPTIPVVVITGGVQRRGACYRAYIARHSARLVLAARGEAALNEAADECLSLGARVLVHAVDMAEESAAEELRRAAVAEFGRIDVWINCAAVLLFGLFEETPSKEFRRVLETNLFGYASGARAALKQFRSQGGLGTLINVSSLLGVVPEPYVSAYVASKFAIRGLTGCIRQEVRNTPGIHVCTVLPAALDTPVYQNAGNYMRQQARSIIPVYDPDRVGRAIHKLSRRPRPERVVSGFGWFIMFSTRLFPRMTERAIGRLAPRLQFKAIPASQTSGNLSQSTQHQYSIEGGWRRYWLRQLARGGNN